MLNIAQQRKVAIKQLNRISREFGDDHKYFLGFKSALWFMGIEVEKNRNEWIDADSIEKNLVLNFYSRKDANNRGFKVVASVEEAELRSYAMSLIDDELVCTLYDNNGRLLTKFNVKDDSTFMIDKDNEELISLNEQGAEIMNKTPGQVVVCEIKKSSFGKIFAGRMWIDGVYIGESLSSDGFVLLNKQK